MKLDLSFDLNHSDGIGSNDDQKAGLILSIIAHIDGDGIGDYITKAKAAAADEASGK